jgi:hypothetical protein
LIHHLLPHTNGADWLKVNQFFAEQLAYIADKLSRVQEGDRTLLDNSMVLYCSSMMTGNHENTQLPVVLVGRGGGGRSGPAASSTIRAGRTARCAVCTCRCSTRPAFISIALATRTSGWRKSERLFSIARSLEPAHQLRRHATQHGPVALLTLRLQHAANWQELLDPVVRRRSPPGGSRLPERAVGAAAAVAANSGRKLRRLGRPPDPAGYF